MSDALTRRLRDFAAKVDQKLDGFKRDVAATSVDLTGYYTKAEIDALLADIGTPPVSPPVFSVAPAITGTATEGQTLSATTGTASNSPTYALQWKRNGTAISGATGSTYLLVTADVGTAITVTSTATNAGGSVSSTSAATATVAATASGLDPALSAPTLSADPTSPANGSSPKFFIDSDDTLDIALGYKVVVQWRDKDGNVLGTGESAQLTAAPNNSDITISGLAALTAGTRRYRARYERTNGSAFSAWSVPDLAVGPDDVAPVLSNPTATDIGSSGAILGVSTDTGEGTLYLVVVAANDQPSNAQIKAGQNSSGAAAVYAANQTITTSGAKTFSASGFSAGTGYYPFFLHRDAAGNEAVLPGGLFTTVAPSAAKLWQGAAGTNRHADMTVDGTGFIASNTTTQGGSALVRSTATPLPTKVKSEITVLSLTAGSFNFGIAELAQSLAGYLKPGNASIAGFSMRVAATDREFYFENTSGLFSSTAAAVGDVWSMEVDYTNPAAPIVWLDCKPSGGAAANVLGGLTINSLVPGTPSIVVGATSNASIKINNGQEAWVITPRTGFVGATA